MIKSVSKKMGIKRESRSVFINADEEAVKAIDLPEVEVASSLSGEFDYIHLFAKSQADIHKYFGRLMKHLVPSGMLWVSWPKGGQMDTDLTLKIVIKMGYYFGLVESKALSINATWSALKFTHPKKGKVYKNSFGNVKDM